MTAWPGTAASSTTSRACGSSTSRGAVSGFDGLNLTFETREGILKHCSRVNAEKIEAEEPGGVARALSGRHAAPPRGAARANLADEIAYNAHDIDDGVRSGLITVEQLAEVGPCGALSRRGAGGASRPGRGQERRLLFETIRRMLSHQVLDVIDATRGAASARRIAGPDDARRSPALVRFGEEMRVASRELKRFLFRALYRHPKVAPEHRGGARRGAGAVRPLP